MMSIVWLVGLASVVLALFLVSQLVKSKPDKDVVIKNKKVEIAMRGLQRRAFRLGGALFVGMFAVLAWFSVEWSFVAFLGGVVVSVALMRMTMWTHERAAARNDVVRGAGSNAILVSSVALLSSAALVYVLPSLVAFGLGAACIAFFDNVSRKDTGGNTAFFAMLMLGVSALSAGLQVANAQLYVLLFVAASIVAACIGIALAREDVKRGFVAVVALVFVFQSVLASVLLGGFMGAIVSAVVVVAVLYVLAWYYEDRMFRPVKTVLRALTGSVSEGVSRMIIISCETIIALVVLVSGMMLFRAQDLLVFGLAFVSFAPFVLFLRNYEVLQRSRLLFARWFEALAAGVIALVAVLAYVAHTVGVVGPAGGIINVLKIPVIVALVLGVVVSLVVSALASQKKAHLPVVFLIVATLIAGFWVRGEALIAFVLGAVICTSVVSLIAESARSVSGSARVALTSLNGKDASKNAMILEEVASRLPQVQMIALVVSALALTFVSVFI